MTPIRPGECVRLEVQEHYRGQWRAAARTPCAALAKTGKATVFLAASKMALGYPYRIRAVFSPGHDTTVHGADSSWQYIMIER